ncbi:unnamed protein product [Lactuca virosa]|uniref:Uncharacterized protein n=1 Tax=Lactuca virosa TaxID=75947 RepID=A0AAU9PR31_9ASTR|nr:unnamed protein product [Lactuca virosa]
MASSSRGGGKKGNSKRSRVVDSSVSQRVPNPQRQNSGELAFLDSQQEASTSGKLLCGGMITIILKHPALAIRFPPGLDVIAGETRITTKILKNMHLFHIDYETEAIYWAVDSRVPIPEPDPDSDEDELISNATIPDVAAPVQQEPIMHPHHDMYMKELRRLHEDNRRLHHDYSELYDSVCEISTEMVEFREVFYTFRDNQRARNQHVDSLVTDMHRVLCLGGQPTQPPYYPQYPHYPPPYNP